MSTSPLASPEPWDGVADAYVGELLPMFDEFARAALRLVPADGRVVDLCAGPGSLARQAAAHGAKVTALDFSPGMLAHLRSLPGGDRVEVREGDAQALPFEDASFDAGYLMFGLMFVSDRAKALTELHRVVRPDGGVVVATWTPLAADPTLGAMFAALVEVVGPQPGPRMDVWTEPEVCEAELAAAGFADVAVHRRSHVWTFTDAGEALRFMLRTAAPLRQMVQQMGAAWPAVAAKWDAQFAAAVGAGPVEVGMRALLTVGRRG